MRPNSFITKTIIAAALVAGVALAPSAASAEEPAPTPAPCYNPMPHWPGIGAPSGFYQLPNDNPPARQGIYWSGSYFGDRVGPLNCAATPNTTKVAITPAAVTYYEAQARKYSKVPAKFAWSGRFAHETGWNLCYETKNKTGHKVRVNGELVPRGWWFQYCSASTYGVTRHAKYTFNDELR